MTAARVLAALALALPAAVPAAVDAAPAPGLSFARAEAAARAALAPAAVDAVLCWRPTPGFRGRSSRRHAICLADHPAADGEICRSLVDVRGTGVRVVRAIVCMRVELAQPLDRG
jgi:hypothetical protein